jgi:hypothetical protein
MAYKHRTVTVDVDVYIDDVINEADDEQLIDELNIRGYHVQKDPVEYNDIDKFELDWLLELVDKNNTDVYTNRVRDKLHKLRHG